MGEWVSGWVKSESVGESEGEITITLTQTS